jgi:hypothetical protein
LISLVPFVAYNSRVTSERWQRIEDLYHSALEQKQADRASFLADACQGDAELKHEVEVLLANEQRARSFLESDAVSGLRMPALKPGTQWLRYRIVAHISSGGMGEVYRAVDTKGRPVALKFLPGGFGDARLRKRFQREVQLASALNHPHILTVHDAGEFENVPYLVMEFVDGGTLYDWSRREPRNWQQVAELLVGAADGLRGRTKRAFCIAISNPPTFW